MVKQHRELILSLPLVSPQECGGVLVICFSASNGATDDLPRFTLGSLENRLKLTDTSAAEGTKRFALCRSHIRSAKV